MEIIQTDLAIIGGGAAGLRAAIAAAEHHQKLTIALVSKVYPVRSHTVSAEGGIAGVLREYDSLEQHGFDTVRGSDFLADQDAVEFFVKEAPREIIQLEHWGCPWSREPNGTIASRAFGGMSVKRTVYAADKTGFYMLHSLFERSTKHANIRRFDEWFATKIFADATGATGFFAYDMRRGTFAAFQAKAIILATGGAGKVYSFTTNGNIKTGDGMALALAAGAALKDMEFVQFHPTGLPRTGILITEGARGEGGYLLNKDSERFMNRYLPSKMELGPRDIISRSIMSEIKAGRAFEGPHGAYVHLDIRHLGEKLIDEKLPLVREMAIEFAGIDPVKEPIPVRPVAHYFMGGVSTNVRAETELPGLYAAGETACVSINGANRLGSNSLAECLVFGRVAGENAGAFAAQKAVREIPQSLIEEEEKRLLGLLNQQGTERVAPLREELQNALEEHAGIERSSPSLAAGIEKILELQKRALRIGLADRSRLFNTDFASFLELENMLAVAETVMRGAFKREESRGSHLRTDFPKRDDERFLKHFCVKKSPQGFAFEEKPVSITKWQPAERKY